MSDGHVVEAMKLFGGNFARALAEACYRADAENLRRIKAAFPEMWQEYDGLARLHAARQAKEKGQ